MKSREKKGRLVMLLARGFLGFTAAVVAVTLLAYMLSNLYYNQLTRVPDYDGLRKDSNLLSGDYDAVQTEKYMGKEGAFAVLDSDGSVLYRSSELIRPMFTSGELACIQDYDEYSYTTYTPFVSQDGRKEYLFTRYIYDGESTEEKVMILNDQFQVIAGGFEDGRKIYTATEVSYLTGDAAPGFDLLQCSIDGGRTLLCLSKIQDYAYYTELLGRADRIYIVIIPLYILVLAFFLIWINRQIKNPLVQLNQAIDSLASGGDARTGNLMGPWEIRQIGMNFDRMADMLEESEKQRRKLDEERQKLLADISHDLKTPITVISGYTRAIRDGKVPQEKLDTYLQLIDSKAEELNGLVNSFHEFSKVEHPEFTLQTERMDVCEFLRGYLAERYDEIEISGFSLKAMIPDDKSIYCYIDGKQMRRALDNILYNTLRHNSLGTVLAVAVGEVSRGIGDLPCVRIIVADNGIGIPVGKREKIFEPFVTGNEARKGSGSGLGLAITRRIIQAHGGNVRLCDPVPGGYSTEFEILLRKVE